MSSPSKLPRWPALAAVIAGAALLTAGVYGVARVDTRLQVATAAQQAAAAKAEEPPHKAKRDRERV